VIAVSERVAADLAREYASEAPTTVIYHGVDADRFTPALRAARRAFVRARHRVGQDEVVFLFVGDLRKGALAVLAALARVPGARGLFVSRTAPDPYVRAAQAQGVAGRAVFAPPTDSIEDYYAAADGFVFPSPYDSFGMVVSEAMASGLPVIASNEAGASELITDRVDGFIVRTADELAGRMAELVADADLRERLGCAARRRVFELSWDRVAEETMTVYRRVVERATE
jgi:glycosyltransferase involved in cell wall biosynthesis